MSEYFDPFAGGSISKTYPLTSAQREVWLATQLGGDEANASYNESVSLDFPGRINTSLLVQAINHLVFRHEALRATVSSDGANLCIMDSMDIIVDNIDLADSIEDDKFIVQSVIEEDMRTPFILANGPLLRAKIISLASEKTRVILTAHHIICDGWSFGILLDELAKYYTALSTGEHATLQEPQQYSEYSARELQKDETQHLNYWLNRHQELAEPLDFPTDNARPARRTYEADRVDVEIGSQLTQALRDFSRAKRSTFFTLTYAAFCVYISRISQAKDFVLGVPYAGQLSSGMTNLVGHCVNILPFRIRTETDQSFDDFLKSVTEELGAGFDHAELSFGSLVSALAISRDASRVPLVPITFNLDKNNGDLVFADQTAELSTNIRRYEPFDLAMNLVDRGDTLLAEWSYNTNLFTYQSIKARADAFIRLLEFLVKTPDVLISNLPILTQKEMNTLDTWNKTHKDYSELMSVPEWFSATASTVADKIAIEYHDTALTYAHAKQRINNIHAELVYQGIKPGSLIGLFVERSLDLPLTMMAVMQAGCAYVPLDPTQPLERLTNIVADAKVAGLITNTEMPQEISCLTELVIQLDEVSTDRQLDAASKPATLAMDSLAYVIYTSGSTGKPKGVAVKHMGLANIIRSFQTEPGFSEQDRLLAVTTAAFDIAALEMFLPLVTGATLCIAPEKTVQDPQALGGLLHQHQVSVLQCVPTTWRLLTAYGGTLPKDLIGWCGGEALPEDLARTAWSQLKEFWNVYGPTETTIWSTVTRITHNPKSRTIGKPIDNTQLYVLDAHKGRLPIGVPGKLWIAGQGVAAGYHQRPAMTAERFQDNLFDDNGVSPVMYDTGDMARFRSDGSVEYLGREDFQVKIRGYRIELGEIESLLMLFPDIRASVVHTIASVSGNPVLVAYFVADIMSIEHADLRAHLSKQLPDYMVPAAYVQLDRLPLNANGKVDRSKLPAPEGGTSSTMEIRLDSAFIAPNDDLEVTIASKFQKHLGKVRVSMSDNFFEYGGDSLSAVQLIVELNDELNIKLPLAVLLHSPTPRDLANRIRQDGGRLSIKSVVRLRREDDGVTVFCLMGIQVYAALANALGPGYNVYALLGRKEDEFLQNMFQVGESDASTLDIPALADEYTELILKTKATGPYRLLGYSSGGVVAIEVAKRLRKLGHKIELIGLLDTILPRGVIRSKKRWFKYHLKELGAAPKRLMQTSSKEVETFSEETSNNPRYAEHLLIKRDELLWASIEEWDAPDQYYEGDAILFKATDISNLGHIQFADDLGWRAALKGSLHIVNVTGDHASLLNETNSMHIAKELRKVLGSA